MQMLKQDAAVSFINLLADGDMKVESSFAFQNSPEAWIFFLLILPAVLFFSFFMYRIESPGVPRKVKAALALLRCLSLLVILCCLFRPVMLMQKVREVRPVLLMLLDNSASMQEHDLYADEPVREALAKAAGFSAPDGLREVSRSELAKRVFTGGPLDVLDERYDIHYCAFNETVSPSGGFDDLSSKGDSTRMGDALADVVKEYRGRRLAQIVLVSDGRSNRGRSPSDGAALAASEQIPVHTVGVGDPTVSRNIEITGVNAPSVVLVGDEVIFKADLSSRGFEGRPVRILLKNKEDGSIMSSKETELKGGEIEQQESLYWKPEREGSYRIEVEVPVQAEEQDGSDNRFTVLLRVESAQIMVLYVDGYPRWEYRFLKNMLVRVKNFEAQIFLQSADPDFIQESSDGVPALERVPDELDQLMKYHVIVFGDVDPNKLGEDRGESRRILENIKEFVKRGGGFLMQAGVLHSPAAFIDTAIADILPVIPGNYAEEMMTAGRMGDDQFRLKLENPLNPPPLMRLIKDPVENRSLWEDPERGLSGFYWYSPLERAKPGAEVFARHPTNENRHGRHVIIATTYYPSGRTAFVGIDSTWRWRFPYGDRYHDLFWRKMVRYLAQNKLRRKDYRFDLNTDQSRYDMNERVHINARILDVNYEPSTKPVRKIKTMDPKSRIEECELNLVGDGEYEGVLIAQKPGTHQLWIEDETGADPGEARHALTSYTVTIPRLEAENPVLDRAVLEKVARITGGKYYGLEQAAGLTLELDDEIELRPLSDPERRDLWSSWWVLLLFTGLFAAEWIIRKRRNLL